jgi:arylsulfatase
VTKHRTPWELGATTMRAFADDVWELYDTTGDWTQAVDVSGQYPAKLAELKEKFLIEAARYQVLPLDDRTRERPSGARSGHPAAMSRTRRARLLPSLQPLEERAAPNFKNTSYRLEAALRVGPEPCSAVVLSNGGRFGGFALYLLDSKPVFCQNVNGTYRGYVRSDAALAAGEHTITFEFTYDGGGLGRGGTGRLSVDGALVAEGRIERSTPLMYGMGTTLDVGVARGTPVTEEFLGNSRSAVHLSGAVLHHVDVLIGDDQLQPPREELERVDLATH